jgi:DNA transformation protein
MTLYSEFVEFVLEQMTPFGRPTARAMFSGYGLYRADRIFAIIVDDRLYFKVDASTRAEFEAKGSRPFTYVARGKTVTMSYFEAPPEVFEDPDAMRFWAQKACEAAVGSNASKARARTPRSRKRR